MLDMHGGDHPGTGRVPVRVFISYAHDDQAHEGRVRDFWVFLRAHGVDARLDLPTAEQRVDWAEWMAREVRDADRVLVIASPEYRRRAEGHAGPAEGRGVQWEARLIRDLFYADQRAALGRFVPVVLPGCSAHDIPLWLAPASAKHYLISEYTVAGAEGLLRLLTGQPEVVPPLTEPVVVLPPRSFFDRTSDRDQTSRHQADHSVGRSAFVSYSHNDERYRHRLDISLVQLRRNNLISIWHDKKILPGQEWGQEIDTNLESADIILLLVSPDFLASEYAYSREMLRAVERHQAGSATVVPIILRPSDWQDSPLGVLQALPSAGRPVTSWPNRDRAWLDIAQGLRRLISNQGSRF